jgi:hypothetical protein
MKATEAVLATNAPSDRRLSVDTARGLHRALGSFPRARKDAEENMGAIVGGTIQVETAIVALIVVPFKILWREAER